MFQPALHIHFAQSVTSMRQKETIHVFSGNRKVEEYMLLFFWSLNFVPLIVFLCFSPLPPVLSSQLCYVKY